MKELTKVVYRPDKGRWEMRGRVLCKMFLNSEF